MGLIGRGDGDDIDAGDSAGASGTESEVARSDDVDVVYLKSLNEGSGRKAGQAFDADLSEIDGLIREAGKADQVGGRKHEANNNEEHKADNGGVCLKREDEEDHDRIHDDTAVYLELLDFEHGDYIDLGLHDHVVAHRVGAEQPGRDKTVDQAESDEQGERRAAGGHRSQRRDRRLQELRWVHVGCERLEQPGHSVR